MEKSGGWWSKLRTSFGFRPHSFKNKKFAERSRIHYDGGIRSRSAEVVIVEGPDGSGKTTLCKRLSDLLDWPIAPRVVSQDTTITGDRHTLMDWVDENLSRGFQRTIFDRHRLISEPIYGPLFRGGLQDGFDDYNWFGSRWAQFQVIPKVVIYCLPPLDAVMRNLRDDEHNEVVRDKTPLVYWQYWAMACRSTTSIVHNYVEWPGVRSIVEIIKEKEKYALGT